MAMDALLPSEIARMVYGYLLEEKCTEAARLFLWESSNLEECRQVLSRGRHFSTRVCGLTLLDVLEKFCLLNTIVQEKLENFDELDKLRHCSDLTSQIKVLFEEYKGQNYVSTVNTATQSTPSLLHGSPSKLRKRRIFSDKEDDKTKRIDQQFTEESQHILDQFPLRSVETTPLKNLPGYVGELESEKHKNLNSKAPEQNLFKSITQQDTMSHDVQLQKIQKGDQNLQLQETQKGESSLKKRCHDFHKGLNVQLENLNRLDSQMQSELRSVTVLNKNVMTETEQRICTDTEVQTSEIGSPESEVEVAEILSDFTEKLINRTEVVKKIAENINVELEPIKSNVFVKTNDVTEGCSKSVIADFNKAIEAAANKSENDPEIMNLLNAIVLPSEEILTENKAILDAQRGVSCSSSQEQINSVSEEVVSETSIEKDMIVISSNVNKYKILESKNSDKSKNTVNQKNSGNLEVNNSNQIVDQVDQRTTNIFTRSTDIKQLNSHNSHITVDKEKNIRQNTETFFTSLNSLDLQKKSTYNSDNVFTHNNTITSTPIKTFTAIENYDTCDWFSTQDIPMPNVSYYKEETTKSVTTTITGTYTEATATDTQFLSPITYRDTSKIIEKINCTLTNTVKDQTLHTPDVLFPPKINTTITVNSDSYPMNSTQKNKTPKLQKTSEIIDELLEIQSSEKLNKNLDNLSSDLKDNNSNDCNKYFNVDSMMLFGVDSTISSIPMPLHVQEIEIEDSITLTGTGLSPFIKVLKKCDNTETHSAEDTKKEADSELNKPNILFATLDNERTENNISELKMTENTKHTPMKIIENHPKTTRKSLSTPKKPISYVRALNFDTPMNRSQSESKVDNTDSCLSPDSIKRNLKNSCKSSLFQSPPLTNSEFVKQNINANILPTIPELTTSENKALKKDSSSLKKESTIKSIVTEQKSWDSELRKYLGTNETSYSSESNSKKRSRSESNRKSYKKAKRDDKYTPKKEKKSRKDEKMKNDDKDKKNNAVDKKKEDIKADKKREDIKLEKKKEDIKIDKKKEDIKADKKKEHIKVDKKKEDIKTDKKKEDIKADKKKEDIKADKKKEDIKADKKKEHIKADKKKENIKTDKKKEDIKVDKKKEDIKSDKKKEHIKADEKKEDIKSDKKKEHIKADEKKEDIKSDKKKEHIKADQKKEDIKSDKKKEHIKADKKKEDIKADKIKEEIEVHKKKEDIKIDKKEEDIEIDRKKEEIKDETKTSHKMKIVEMTMVASIKEGIKKEETKEIKEKNCESKSIISSKRKIDKINEIEGEQITEFKKFESEKFEPLEEVIEETKVKNDGKMNQNNNKKELEKLKDINEVQIKFRSADNNTFENFYSINKEQIELMEPTINVENTGNKSDQQKKDPLVALLSDSINDDVGEIQNIEELACEEMINISKFNSETINGLPKENIQDDEMMKVFQNISNKLTNQILSEENAIATDNHTKDVAESSIEKKSSVDYAKLEAELSLITNSEVPKSVTKKTEVIYDEVSKFERGKIVQKKYARLKTLDTKLALNKFVPLNDFALDFEIPGKDEDSLQVPPTPQVLSPGSSSLMLPLSKMSEDSRTFVSLIATPLECPKTPNIVLTPMKGETTHASDIPQKIGTFCSPVIINFESTNKPEITQFEVIKENLITNNKLTMETETKNEEDNLSKIEAPMSYRENQDEIASENNGSSTSSKSSCSCDSCCSATTESSENQKEEEMKDDATDSDDDSESNGEEEDEDEEEEEEEEEEQEEDEEEDEKETNKQSQEILAVRESSPAKVFSINKSDKELAETAQETPAKDNLCAEVEIFDTPNISKPAEPPTNLSTKISQMILKDQANKIVQIKPKPKIISVKRVLPKVITKPPTQLIKALPKNLQAQALDIRNALEPPPPLSLRLKIDKSEDEVALAIKSIENHKFNKSQDELLLKSATPSPANKSIDKNINNQSELAQAIESLTRTETDTIEKFGHGERASGTDDDCHSDANFQLVLEDNCENDKGNSTDKNIEGNEQDSDSDSERTSNHSHSHKDRRRRLSNCTETCQELSYVFNKETYKRTRRKAFSESDLCRTVAHEANLLLLKSTLMEVLLDIKPNRKKPVRKAQIKRGKCLKSDESSRDSMQTLNNDSESLLHGVANAANNEVTGKIKRPLSEDEPSNRRVVKRRKRNIWRY